MERDDLRELIKMDFPKMRIDKDKVITACMVEKKPNIFFTKMVVLVSCLLLTGAIILTISLFIDMPSYNSGNNTIVDNGEKGIETVFQERGGESKPLLPFDIGYKAESKVFKIDEVEVELMIGHFFGPPSKFILYGEEKETMSYEEWRNKESLYGENYKEARIVIRTKSHPLGDTYEEVYVVDNFYYDYPFIYDDEYYEYEYERNGVIKTHRSERITNIKPRNTIKNFKIDSKYFIYESGYISIGLSSYGGIKYVYLYYYIDKEKGLIYISEKSVDDALLSQDSSSGFDADILDRGEC